MVYGLMVQGFQFDGFARRHGFQDPWVVNPNPLRLKHPAYETHDSLHCLPSAALSWLKFEGLMNPWAECGRAY